jgi:hypothetical protein
MNPYLILFGQSFIMGIVTYIIGTIIFNLSINRNNKNDKTNKEMPKGIGIAFFMTGFVIHIILDTIGFNKWYCNKECTTRLCRLATLNKNI